MAIAIPASRQTLADAYKNIGGANANVYVGACTGNPGTATTPANEATGGGYARVATTWSSGSTGTITGTSVTLNVAATTYTHIIMCNTASGAGLTDWSDTTDVVMSSAGTLVVSPVYTQT